MPVRASAPACERPIGELRPRAHRPLEWYATFARALKRDARAMDREIESWVGKDPRDLTRYQKQFGRDVGRAAPTAALRRSECIERAASFDVVFVSDVHSSIAPQNVCVDLLETMCDSGPVALVLEIARTDQQKHLDAYMAGTIALKTLEKRLDWGFDFKGYARQLELAKARGAIVVAGNSRGSLVDRDRAAATVIAETAAKYPNHKILVQFGQLHLGGGHLVTKTRPLLEASGVSKSICRVFTGDLNVYYDLARKGLFPQAVRFDDSTFCIFANTPRTSRKGYLNYLDR